MKNFFNILIRILGGLIIFIAVALISEWVYSEIKFQIWLRQDESRLDFSTYDTPEELRQDILAILPLGNSEEAVQAFVMAQGSIYQKPTISSYYDGSFLVTIVRSQAGRGFFGFKRFVLPYESWGIHFILDPNDHTLIDINIISQGGI